MTSEQRSLYNVLNYHSQSIKKYSDKYNSLKNQDQNYYQLDYYGRLLFREVCEYIKKYEEAKKLIPNQISQFPQIVFPKNNRGVPIYTNIFFIIR